jgi:hypothetical protein
MNESIRWMRKRMKGRIDKPASSGGSIPETIASFTLSSLRKCLERI